MKKKIIIADDNKTFLMYMGLLLKRFDFKVWPAEQGIEVLKLLHLVGADIVILDVHMELMDGLSTLRKIREDKRTANVPVIMVSSDLSRETEENCRKYGCFDYLRKPIKVNEVHASLQKCFFSDMGKNRRYLRTPYNGKVVVTHNGFEYKLYAETLSEGGIYIRKEDPLPVGSAVEVEVSLEGREPIQMKGTVIYIKKLFGDFLALSPGMAIVFEGQQEEEKQALRIFVEDLIARDIFEGQEEVLIKR